MFKRLLLFLCLLGGMQAYETNAQGVVTGDLELFQNFFFLDSSVLSNQIPPQYYQQLSSTDAWLNLNYRKDDLTIGVRFDLFLNSGLRNPYIVQNNQGIGFWFARKKLDKLELTVGNFYDQFGNGITFRAYEGRGQNLDYAMFGMHAKYQLNDKWQMKGFVGRQKFLFETYRPVIKGLNLDGNIQLAENVFIRPGASVVNRTLDNNTMNLVVAAIENEPVGQRFIPKYNAFAYSAYNSLDWGRFNWNFEIAGKTREAVQNREGQMINKPGSVVLTGIGYAQPGFGFNMTYKRTSFYEFRVSPLEILNDGLVNFIPPSARMNTYRLTARYAPATQLIGEEGVQADAVIDLGGKGTLMLNGSNVTDLSGNLLFREFYSEVKFKLNKQWSAMAGLQRVMYNQEIYEFKPGAPLVRTITPFAEVTYKINRKKSLRAEISHMQTRQDLGSWWWGLLEYNIAPKYSISIMDMWNYGNKDPLKRIHYYTIFGAMNLQKLRLTGGYVRQVEGVICTGGVCRIEPAFNGMRFSLTSSF